MLSTRTALHESSRQRAMHGHSEGPARLDQKKFTCQHSDLASCSDSICHSLRASARVPSDLYMLHKHQCIQATSNVMQCSVLLTGVEPEIR